MLRRVLGLSSSFFLVRSCGFLLSLAIYFSWSWGLLNDKKSSTYVRESSFALENHFNLDWLSPSIFRYTPYKLCSFHDSADHIYRKCADVGGSMVEQSKGEEAPTGAAKEEKPWGASNDCLYVPWLEQPCEKPAWYLALSSLTFFVVKHGEWSEMVLTGWT